MRAFLLAVVTAFVIAGVASFVLGRVQENVDEAFTKPSVRLDVSQDESAGRVPQR
jgi:hypothetical protein